MAKETDELAKLEWKDEDRTRAVPQGWNLYPVYDDKTARWEMMIGFAIHENTQRFETDQAAVGFVKSLVEKGDPLATKAMRIAFTSKIRHDAGVKPRKRK